MKDGENMIPRKIRIKHFLIHTLIKILIFAIALGVITFAINFPGIANELAMGQLENDNFSYGFWSAYNTARNIYNSCYEIIISFFIGTIIYDIYAFIKHNKGEK